MTVLRCKMCGASLTVAADATVTQCAYCGTSQTLPRINSERKNTLYERANDLRRSNEYDKAEALYEQLLVEDSTDAEVYWSLVLCRYGIVYVKDPATHKQIPTINRAQFTSVFQDPNYKRAVELADASQRAIYEQEAAAINEIQRHILAVSQKEEPFDVFICYKETDFQGRRTMDSVLATELYYQLVKEGFKVFFSRITLEDKLGSAYEPYIFAALHSAKVMVVLGTSKENFEAVWVKNEWSRFLALIRNGAEKALIPAYKDMDAYDLPEEFAHLQAQDMTKLGFMQDLVHGIRKITGGAISAVSQQTVSHTAPLLKRAFLALEDGDFEGADDFLERVLNDDPENAQAYLGKLLVEMRAKSIEDFQNRRQPIDGSLNYKRALRFGDAALQKMLEECNEGLKNRALPTQKEQDYKKATALMHNAPDETAWRQAAILFKAASGYADADAKYAVCMQNANQKRNREVYEQAYRYYMKGEQDGYTEALRLFRSIAGYQHADEFAEQCERKLAEIESPPRQTSVETEEDDVFRARDEKWLREGKKENLKAAILNLVVQVGLWVFSSLLVLVIGSYDAGIVEDIYNIDGAFVGVGYFLMWIWSCAPSVIFHTVVMLTSLSKASKVMGIIDKICTAFGYLDCAVGVIMLLCGIDMFVLAIYVLSIGIGQVFMNSQVRTRHTPYSLFGKW